MLEKKVKEIKEQDIIGNLKQEETFNDESEDSEL